MRNNDVAGAFTYCEWFLIVCGILKNRFGSMSMKSYNVFLQ